MYNEQQYIPKIEETEVRKGGDMAMGAGQMAMQGASMGAAAGPWGAAIGGAAGLTAGAAQQIAGMMAEKKQRATDKAMNTQHYNSLNRLPNEQRYQTLQAKKGIKSNRYQKIEIEGGKTKDAPGELVVNTKTYDLRYDSTGDKPHEKGGKKITLGKNEAVIDSQNDPDAYSKFKSAMMKYKLRKDPAAKRYMDDTINNLPTQDETRKNNKGELLADDGIIIPEEIGPSPIQREQGVNPYITAPPTTPIPPGGNPEQSVTPYFYKSDQPTMTGGSNVMGKAMGLLGGAGKYANVAHNLIKGSEAPDRVQRRYHGFEDRKYVDRSDAMRDTVEQQANATRRTLRGSGLSAGQKQNYGASISSKAEQQLNTINTGEAQRADAINDQNYQRRQATQAINLDLANRYDEQDAQAKAATEDYTDKGISELAQRSEIGEQTSYMKSADAAKEARDQKAIEGGTYDYGTFRYGADGKARMLPSGEKMSQEEKDQHNIKHALNYYPSEIAKRFKTLSPAEKVEFVRNNPHRMSI